MLFTAVRSQEFVSLTVGFRWGLMDKMLMASSLPDSRRWVWGNSRGSHMWCWFFGGCDMAAGGWGSLYAKRGNKFCQMSPRATDSETRLLPSTQEFPASKHGNSKLKSCGAVWSFACHEAFILWMSWKHTHTHTCRLREDRREGKMVTDDTWKRCPCNEVSLLPRSLRGGGLFDFKEGQSGIEWTRWHTRMAKAIINDTCISSVFLYLQHFPAKDIFQKQFYCFQTFHTASIITTRSEWENEVTPIQPQIAAKGQKPRNKLQTTHTLTSTFTLNWNSNSK